MAVLGWAVLLGATVAVAWSQSRLLAKLHHPGRLAGPGFVRRGERPDRVSVVSFLVDQGEAIVAFTQSEARRATTPGGPSLGCRPWGTVCVDVGAGGGDLLARWRDRCTALELRAGDDGLCLRSDEDEQWLVVR